MLIINVYVIFFQIIIWENGIKKVFETTLQEKKRKNYLIKGSKYPWQSIPGANIGP